MRIRIIKIPVDHGSGLCEKFINYCVYDVFKLIPDLHELWRENFSMVALPTSTNNLHSDSGQKVSYVVLTPAEKKYDSL